MKKSLYKLAELITAISEVWDYDKRFISMHVLIQNMAAKDENTDESEYEPYIKVFKLNAEFRSDCHLSQWVYDEVKMIVDGHFMSKYIDEEEERKRQTNSFDDI